MNRQINRHKKLPFYSSGMISLVLLPFLCLLYYNKQKVFEIPRVMEVIWYGKNSNCYFLEDYSEEFSLLVHPKRKFSEINLTGNKLNDEQTLEFAQNKIKNLVSTNDTINGVHFHFSKFSKFSSLVRALEICKIEKVNFFVPRDNDIWVFNYKPLPKPKDEILYSMTCGGTSQLMDEKFRIKSADEIEICLSPLIDWTN